MTIKPPPIGVSIPIVVAINHLYKNLYLLGKKIPKRDKLGLHSNIEKGSLECLELSIAASFSKTNLKSQILEKLQINIEILKQLVRLANTLKIYSDEIYIALERNLQEISKMSAGWLKYINQKKS